MQAQPVTDPLQAPPSPFRFSLHRTPIRTSGPFVAFSSYHKFTTLSLALDLPYKLLFEVLAIDWACLLL